MVTRRGVMTNNLQKFGDSTLYKILDEDQLQAVNYRGSNLLILAGAGSGKTHTLTHRAISLLKEVSPENMMVVTFTKKAAQELYIRISESAPEILKRNLKKAWIGTIHSICWRMLKENGNLVNLQPNWSVIDMPDAERVMRLSAKAFGYDSDSSKNIYQLYSYARNSMTEWTQWENSARFGYIRNFKNVGQAIESFNRRCNKCCRVDFDDLQVLALNLLEQNPEVRRAYQDRFQVIMVDEYQDTNHIQAEILELLASNKNTITVVGDDSQAIYGFRAATVDNILHFENDFDARRITIRTNYRSTPEIVALANASIKNNRNQIFKEIRSDLPSYKKPVFFFGQDPSVEAKFIINQIHYLLNEGKPIEDNAVLFRATRQVAILEVELKRAGIPYVIVGGEDFFTLEHIKLILNMARLLINPEDSISLASLQDLIGFSSSTALEETEAKAEVSQLSFWDIVAETSKTTSYNRSEYQSLLNFRNEIERIREQITEPGSITPIITSIIKYLEDPLERKFAHIWEDVLSDLSILQTIAAPYSSLQDFLNTVSLQQFVEDEGQAGKLVLSTIHSAKGLEWDSVFVIGLVEFWFPLNWAIRQTGTDEDERRLFYVAVTRAKRHLFLTSYSQAVNQYGSTKQQQLSRFIEELPRNLYGAND